MKSLAPIQLLSILKSLFIQIARCQSVVSCVKPLKRTFVSRRWGHFSGSYGSLRDDQNAEKVGLGTVLVVVLLCVVGMRC